jgi:hypothetical protein
MSAKLAIGCGQMSVNSVLREHALFNQSASDQRKLLQVAITTNTMTDYNNRVSYGLAPFVSLAITTSPSTPKTTENDFFTRTSVLRRASRDELPSSYREIWNETRPRAAVGT